MYIIPTTTTVNELASFIISSTLPHPFLLSKHWLPTQATSQVPKQATTLCCMSIWPSSFSPLEYKSKEKRINTHTVTERICWWRSSRSKSVNAARFITADFLFLNQSATLGLHNVLILREWFCLCAPHERFISFRDASFQGSNGENYGTGWTNCQALSLR